jgi:hypothetical protein
MVADGSVTLTTVALLRPHLTPDTHRELLNAARHRTTSPSHTSTDSSATTSPATSVSPSRPHLNEMPP